MQDDEVTEEPVPDYSLRPFTEDELADLRARLEGIPWEFRTALREHRESAGWSQARLAGELAALGMPLDATAITRIENGKRAVRIEEAWALAAALRLDLDALIYTLTTVMTTEERIYFAEHHLTWTRQQLTKAQREVAEDEAELERLRKLAEQKGRKA